MRKYQIGIVGSAADVSLSKDVELLAERIGELVAKNGHITVYGAEKDYDSLSIAAARGAKRFNGMTVGITYGKGKNIYDKDGNTDVIICTGLEQGGGREFVLVNSCDAIIAVSGNAGTLNELVVAYQLNIPIIVLENSGGWSQKLANQFFDKRKRRLTIGAQTPEDAVSKLLRILDEENLV